MGLITPFSTDKWISIVCAGANEIDSNLLVDIGRGVFYRLVLPCSKPIIDEGGCTDYFDTSDELLWPLPLPFADCICSVLENKVSLREADLKAMAKKVIRRAKPGGKGRDLVEVSQRTLELWRVF